ncbi:hypothetical protein BT96DRAFT_972023 [Gymnopus androsaceus JB14]|uniref:Uncharacterized protein n=1 Tax=Gymnopus androsaceus JB14 TaxID=1447944 RepID=A0A6A4I340_9AGAR|nr:hypothetical protein BT96DRAFT_972023 [Gymnopus androsaceus JB14]
MNSDNRPACLSGPAATIRRLLSPIFDYISLLGPPAYIPRGISVSVEASGARQYGAVFFNRYFAVLGNAVVTVSLFSTSLTESVCRPFHLFRELLLLLTQMSVLVLLTIRIYALYNCSKRILAFMFFTTLILGGLATFSIFFGQSSQSELTATGCHTQLSFITSVRTFTINTSTSERSPSQVKLTLFSTEVAAAWEAVFLYDSILFLMTLNKAYKARHELSELGRCGLVSMFAIILRDGSIYFGIVAFANLVNISTFYSLFYEGRCAHSPAAFLSQWYRVSCSIYTESRTRDYIPRT